jgi:hypothetical protein
MNHVERFRAVMNFQPVDRLPRWEWAMWWDETINRWHKEGLPLELRFSQINRDLLAFNFGLLDKIFRACVPTFMTVAEDMSYNHGPMISNPTFNQFIAPYYQQLVPRLLERDIIPIIDTDGDVTLLAPWFAELGVTGLLPLERQAGVDGLRLRQLYPRLRMIGHFDKMTMNREEGAMRAEFERLVPLMKSGGFIPSVDHQTPPGVSLEQYRSYLRLLREFTS